MPSLAVCYFGLTSVMVDAETGGLWLPKFEGAVLGSFGALLTILRTYG